MGSNKGKIIVFTGLPASGKSTAARERLQHGNVMRVNRDDIRAMLFKQWKGRKEGVVTAIEVEAIRSATANGFDIIVDDTNLHPGTRAKWKTLASQLGVSLVEEDFDTPLEECIRRDGLRVGRQHVGRAVIENMALAYGRLPKIPLSRPVVIFDVDGTVADCMHRKTYLNACKNCGEIEEFHTDPNHDCEGFVGGQKKHKIFYAKVSEDGPIETVIQWMRNCYEAGYYVLVVSGRPTNMAGDETVDWLGKYNAPFYHIFMRAANDFRDDTIVKQDILDKILTWIPKEQILFTVDDRPRVIRMWRANGISCYDVGPGIEF